MKNPGEITRPDSDNSDKTWTDVMIDVKPFESDAGQLNQPNKTRNEEIHETIHELWGHEDPTLEFTRRVGRLASYTETLAMRYGPKEYQVPGIMRGFFYEGETDPSPDDRSAERLRGRSLKSVERLEWDAERIYGGREEKDNDDFYAVIDKYKEAIKEYGPDIESTGVVPVFNLMNLLSWTRNGEPIAIVDKSHPFQFLPPEYLAKQQERILDGLEDAHSRYFSEQTPDHKKRTMTTLLGKMQFKEDLARRTGTFLDAEAYEHPEEHNLPPEIKHYTFSLSDSELDLLANADDDDILANGIKRILPQRFQKEILQKMPQRQALKYKHIFNSGDVDGPRDYIFNAVTGLTSIDLATKEQREEAARKDKSSEKVISD